MPFLIKLPILFILISIGSMFYFDAGVFDQNSFAKSQTGKWLESTGILGVYQTVHKEVTTKLPVAYASVSKAINVDKISAYLSSGTKYVTQLVEPVTTWAYKTIPLKLEYTNDVIIPYMADGIAKFTSEFGTYFNAGAASVKEMSLKLGSWVNENINLDGASFSKIQSTFTTVVHDAQDRMIDVINWAHKKIVG